MGQIEPRNGTSAFFSQTLSLRFFWFFVQGINVEVDKNILKGCQFDFAENSFLPEIRAIRPEFAKKQLLYIFLESF